MNNIPNAADKNKKNIFAPYISSNTPSRIGATHELMPFTKIRAAVADVICDGFRRSFKWAALML